MSYEMTQFRFAKRVELDDVRSTLFLSELAAASLHGHTRVQLEAPARVDEDERLVEIDSSRRAGRTLALIFGGFVQREFGESAVRVERVSRQKAHTRTASLSEAVLS